MCINFFVVPNRSLLPVFARAVLGGDALYLGYLAVSYSLGGFIGIWLGGRLYDMYGNYNLVWWIGIAVGAFSALVHLPIKEQQKTWV